MSPVLISQYTPPLGRHGITLLRAQNAEEPCGLELPNRLTGRVPKMGAKGPGLTLDGSGTWEMTHL